MEQVRDISHRRQLNWKPKYGHYHKRINCPRCNKEIWNCALKKHMRTNRCMYHGIPESERPPQIKIPLALTRNFVPCPKCRCFMASCMLNRHLKTCYGPIEENPNKYDPNS